MNKKVMGIVSALLFITFCTINSFAENAQVTVEVTNVVVNGGKVYVVIFSSADNFKKDIPHTVFELESTNTVMSQRVSMPHGEYVLTAYQDANNNGKLDLGLFSFPKEMVAVSNYFGKGFPTNNFEKQKVPVNDTTGKIILGLYNFERKKVFNISKMAHNRF
jgi:uncharacterized protein (DUF2141 family)